MVFEIIYKEPTLIQVISQMKKLNKLGYETHFEGKGNGMIRIIIEDKSYTILDDANKLLKEV